MKKRPSKNSSQLEGRTVIGWREWLALPQLGISQIKAKIDTGARSSALHAINIEIFQRHGVELVRFEVHPIQRNAKTTVSCECRLLEMRHIRSSTGHLSLRPVVLTDIEMLGQKWPIELTLINRDEMGFRMLLGREAIRGHMLVDTARSYFGGVPPQFRKKRKRQD